MQIDHEPEPPPTESACRRSDEQTDQWHAHEDGEDRIDHGIEAELAGVHDAILPWPRHDRQATSRVNCGSSEAGKDPHTVPSPTRTESTEHQGSQRRTGAPVADVASLNQGTGACGCRGRIVRCGHRSP